MNSMLQDVHYALRQLRRSPVFTLTALLTLALGLGATATMYSVVCNVLLAPLPYPGPQQLVGAGFTFPLEKPNAEEMGASADFLAQHSRSFTSIGIAEDGNAGVNLSFTGTGNGATVAPLQVHARRVSAGYLPTLGVAPLLGQAFTREQDLPHGPSVVLLSYALWQQSFHGDPSIVGRTIHLDEDPYTVVGVMPKNFVDPSTAEPSQLWQALHLSPQKPGYDGDNYQMIGRLRESVSLAAAQAEISALDAPFYQQFPHYRRWTNEAKRLHEYRVWPLAQVLTSQVRSSLLAMMAAVAAVLLIACLNLAGLMTTRGSDRARELAVRRALGAGRLRLLRVLVTEGVLLASCGTALALLFTRIATPLLLAASPLPLPLLQSQHLWQTALFLFAAALAACVLFALLPAWYATGQPAATSLAVKSGADRSQTSFGKALVVAQVALATVLLSGASLLLGTFLRLQAVSPGFTPQQLTVAQVTLKGSNYATTRQTTQFLDKVLAALEHAPGVSRVAAIDGLPLDRGLNLGMRPTGRPDLQGIAELRAATPAYFSTIGIRLLAGRTFNEHDTAGTPHVAVISETAAKRWFQGRSPLGQRVEMQGSEPAPMEVVGVVSDTRNNSLAEPPSVMIYAPYRQLPDDVTKMMNGWITTTFVIRSAADAPLGRLVEQAVSDADPALPVAKLSTMQAMIDNTVAAPRFFSWLSTGFAGFALLLTVLGLFGLLSYQVTQRTREMGLRFAVGATRAAILRLVLGRGMMLTAAGLALGLAGSLAMPRLVASVLEDAIYTGSAPIASVLTSSAVAGISAAAAILCAALLASYLPARKAASIEPMQALRAE